MFRNKIFVTFFSVILFLCGLFIFYFSNINKTLLIDIYAENPLLMQQDKQLNDIHANKYNDNAYTFLLPANFLYQTKTIYFKNTGNENIQLAFYSEQKNDGNKEIEFSLNIKNIQVNGENWHTKKETVWYDRPYIDTVSVKKDEMVSLTVTYKTKLMLRNTYLPQFVASIVLFLCSIALLLKCYWGIIIKYSSKLIQLVFIFLEENGEWDSFFIKKYHELDAVYKKTFWSVFIILNIVFLYYNIHFLWGNHDWFYVMYGMWGEISWFNGRYTAYFPNQLLGGQILPILTVSLALFGYSFVGVLLAYYWKVQKTFFNYLVLSLVVVLNPLVLYWIYYDFILISHLWVLSIILLALILSEKKSFGYFFFAYLLFIFGLGIYASAVCTIGVVYLGKILFMYCFEEISLKLIYQNLKRTFLCVILSLISFKLIHQFLIYINMTEKLYNTTTNFGGGSFYTLFELALDSFKNLFITFPFYDDNILVLFILLGLFSFISLCVFYKKQYGIKVFSFCFIVGGILLLPLACNLTSFITGKNYIDARVLYFGHVFLVAFFIAMILKTKFIWAKNILIIALIFLLPMNICRLVECQKLWKMEFDYENTIIESFVETIGSLPKNQQKELHTAIFFGKYTPYFLSFYQGKFDSLDASGITCDFFNSSTFPGVITLYVPNFKIKNTFRFIREQQNLEVRGSWINEVLDSDKAILDLLPYYDVLKNMQHLYPSKKFVQVQDNFLFINFDNEVLHEVLNVLEREKYKELNEHH